MGIEACRDQYEIGGEVIKRWQNNAAHGIAELLAAIACPKGCIEDIADTGLSGSTRAGIQRHLMGGAIEQIGVRPEYFLGAIAMMHIEINDRHAFRTIACAGIVGGNCHLIEQAETHGPPRFRMVAGRAERAEGVVGPACEDGIDSGGGRPHGAERGFQRAW